MQNVLSIDVTRDPALAVVLGIDGRIVRVLEIQRLSLNGLFARSYLLAAWSDALKNGSGKSGVPEGAADSAGSPPDAANAAPPEADLARFGELLTLVKLPWTSSVLIIPPHDYLSMNIDLPFRDAKQINKVLDLEVQDLVPFSIEEFLVQPHRLAALSTSALSKIHVSMIPKLCIRNILRICRHSHFEPVVISTPAGALGAAYYLAADYLEQDSAIIHFMDGFCCICLRLNGAVYGERIMSCGDLLTDQDARRALLSELKLTLSAYEERHARTFSRLYLSGGHFSEREAQQGLARHVETLKIKELVAGADEEIGLAGLAGIYVRDINPPPVLTNFRTREFSYSPQLKELYRGFKALFPYLTALLLIGVFILGLLYYVRELRIAGIETAVDQEIDKVLALQNGAAATIATLSTANKQLEQELKDLGSPSQYTPLDSFMNISEDLAKAAKEMPSMTVNRLQISTSDVVVEMDSPNFPDGDNIEKILKTKRKDKGYCSVHRKDLGKSGVENKRFRFEIKLCD